MARLLKAPDSATVELDNRKIIRKNRKWHEELGEALRGRDLALAILIICACVPLVMPQIFDLARIMFFILFAWFMLKNAKVRLPLKIPAWAKNVTDYNDAKPGRKSFSKASGILYLGNDINGYELWLRDTDIKTHALIYGTTGSGKTVSLQSIAYNAFVMGTGLCYIDPKGDPKLAHELFIMARRVNREDDFLSLDFMTGGKKAETNTPFRMSNTTNPFATAPADAITNLIASLLPKDDGNNSVFQQKAMALLTALIPVLVALRDAKQRLPLTDMSDVEGLQRAQHCLGSGMSIATIRDYLEPVACVSLVFPLKKKQDKTYSGMRMNGMKEEDGQPSTAQEISPNDEECDAVARFVDKTLLDTFKAALTSLNFVNGGDSPIRQKAYVEQFGYAKGYFGAPLASISGMYGHLFNVTSGEIDMYDILFNRRVLVGILPSLEKSPQECENLGKIILASVKNSVSGGLGTRLEGKTKEVTGALPSASNVPGIIIVDEYAAIMMPGFEIILTQARSLGFMAIIASQDYSGMKGKDAKSCDQIVENTKIKLFMTMASARETWDLAKSLFGSISVEEVNLREPGERGTIRNMDKVNQYDLMSQIEGEFHAFYKGDLIRGATPYMIPKAEYHHYMRINRFVRTDTSPEKVKAKLEEVKPVWSTNKYDSWIKAIREKEYWTSITFARKETAA